MEELERVLKNFVNLKQGVLLKQIYGNFKTEQFILELNRTDQLYNKGIDAKGQTLGQYSPVTIQLKLNGFGDRRVDHITLKDTGEFYESFKLKPLNDGFEISANPIKEDTDLYQEYGEDIIGLNDENKAILAEHLQPLIQEAVLAAILQ